MFPENFLARDLETKIRLKFVIILEIDKGVGRSIALELFEIKGYAFIFKIQIMFKEEVSDNFLAARFHSRTVEGLIAQIANCGIIILIGRIILTPRFVRIIPDKVIEILRINDFIHDFGDISFLLLIAEIFTGLMAKFMGEAVKSARKIFDPRELLTIDANRI